MVWPTEDDAGKHSRDSKPIESQPRCREIVQISGLQNFFPVMAMSCSNAMSSSGHRLMPPASQSRKNTKLLRAAKTPTRRNFPRDQTATRTASTDEDFMVEQVLEHATPRCVCRPRSEYHRVDNSKFLRRSLAPVSVFSNLLFAPLRSPRDVCLSLAVGSDFDLCTFVFQGSSFLVPSLRGSSQGSTMPSVTPSGTHTHHTCTRIFSA